MHKAPDSTDDDAGASDPVGSPMHILLPSLTDSGDRPGRRVPQRGAIVNFASVNSVMSGAATGAYTASKHAVHGLTKTVSKASLHRKQYTRLTSRRLHWRYGAKTFA